MTAVFMVCKAIVMLYVKNIQPPYMSLDLSRYISLDFRFEHGQVRRHINQRETGWNSCYTVVMKFFRVIHGSASSQNSQ